MKKIIIAGLVLMTILISARNTDYKEIIQMTYINSIGFSYDEEKKDYFIIAYNLNNSNLGKVLSGSNEDYAYFIKSKGKSITKAVDEMRKNSDTFLDFGHVSTVVIHESFFKIEHLKHLFEFFVNNQSFFLTSSVYITKEDINKVYKAENFSESSSFYSYLIDTESSNLIKKTPLKNLLSDLILSEYSNSYPVLSLKEEMFQSSENTYISLYVSGVAFLNNEDIGYIYDFEKNKGLIIFYKMVGKNFYFDNYEIIINNYFVNITYKNKLTISISIEGNIINTASNQSLKDIEEQIITYLSNEIILLINETKKENIDILNVNYNSFGKMDFQTTNYQLKFNIK